MKRLVILIPNDSDYKHIVSQTTVDEKGRTIFPSLRSGTGEDKTGIEAEIEHDATNVLNFEEKLRGIKALLEEVESNGISMEILKAWMVYNKYSGVQAFDTFIKGLKKFFELLNKNEL